MPEKAARNPKDFSQIETLRRKGSKTLTNPLPAYRSSSSHHVASPKGDTNLQPGSSIRSQTLNSPLLKSSDNAWIKYSSTIGKENTSKLEKTSSKREVVRKLSSDRLLGGTYVEEQVVSASGTIKELNDKIRRLNEARQKELEDLARRRLLIQRALEAKNIKRNNRTGKYEILDAETGKLLTFDKSPDDETQALSKKETELQRQMGLRTKNSGFTSFGSKKFESDGPLDATIESSRLHDSSDVFRGSASRESAQDKTPPEEALESAQEKDITEEGGGDEKLVEHEKEHRHLELMTDDLKSEGDDISKAPDTLWTEAARKEMPTIAVSPKVREKVLDELERAAKEGIRLDEDKAIMALTGFPSYAFVKYDGGQFKPLTIHLAIHKQCAMIKRNGRFNKLDPAKFNIIDLSEGNLDFLFEDISSGQDMLSVAYQHHPVVLLVSGDQRETESSDDPNTASNTGDMRSVVFVFEKSEAREIFTEVYQFIARRLGCEFQVRR